MRLERIDKQVARAETALAAGLMGGVFLILLIGAGWRSAGHPLAWSDELAVLLMACAGFFGASAALASGRHISVDLLEARLGPRGRARVQGLVRLVLLLALAGFALLLWRWFDPLGLLRAESAQAFAEATFNFVYQEPTVTLGVPKVWAWLVLIPFCAGSLLHVLAQIARLLRGDAPC
ncbi:TRAP transporter small permease subunit [Pseudooceanicola sp. CBS1P-1]|uniref:TRAP transporter small permease protein n=1 Tax=Pseudooceanicola albus TaxID=2692189 RepID=A0A6L7G410_9RHOB|nr:MULTISPECIES: TRAP transporter small permease subunit [Pseudooceanicola]MBT9384545.1 TRAP transporter small permease subunit [Pseudooceanicola endophyticus]MXN18247.1 TRAP transporter small permease subunit [Pseudooceanicola albus]